MLDKCGLAWEGMGVRGLVQRFTARRLEEVASVRAAEERWGRRAVERRRCEPTRAKVLGLRRYWEGVSDVSQGLRV